MKHIMLDLETLGTTADAVILSIGAVCFDLDSTAIDDNGFYASLTVESNLAAGRRISEDTLKWWMKQPPAAQTVFHEQKDTLTDGLQHLVDWFGGDMDYYVWSNGADFDLPMLAHALTSVGLPIPWKFWNSRCFRTYKSLPGVKALTLPSMAGTKHNALVDAYHQAQCAQAIHAGLFPSVKAKK